ncbi:MAG: PqqD family protein [Faecousia sp.]
MKIKEGFVLRTIAGSNIVVPVGAASIDFNGMITLNDSGAFLWRELVQGSDVDGLTAALLREYDVDEVTARTCAAGFIEKLKEANCLE